MKSKSEIVLKGIPISPGIHGGHGENLSFFIPASKIRIVPSSTVALKQVP